MGSAGLQKATAKMRDAGVDTVAIETFAHYYRLLELGETGMIAESSIEPVSMPSLADVEVDDEVALDALSKTVVIKLNGGLGTSMGMDRAKSLLCVRKGLSFLDIIARQIMSMRAKYKVELPLLLMNSFRTSGDTLAALARYTDLPVEGLPLEFMQNQEPKLLVSDLTPVTWPKDPSQEWCPPGHGDIYTALRGTGLLDQLISEGFKYVFISNSDNLGAVPDPRVAGWFATSGAPFAIEAVRRTASDRKGGHFARRLSDGRLVLRETGQTSAADLPALSDLDRHRYMSTNNLWVDLVALKEMLDARNGVLGLPMIRNVKTVDPADPTSPKVIQVETAMGAAIEVFEGAQLIEVGRDRFVPVKTTNDLLVLRSDLYEMDPDFCLNQVVDEIPFVDLGKHYKIVADFEKRFPEGMPVLKEATSLAVKADATFGPRVRIVGDVVLEGTSPQRIEADSVLSSGA